MPHDSRKASISRAFNIANIAFRVAGLDETASEEETSSQEQVGKIVKEGDKWCVKSEHNSDWSGGCYDTKKKAEKRLRQVEYFKHKG